MSHDTVRTHCICSCPSPSSGQMEMVDLDHVVLSSRNGVPCDMLSLSCENSMWQVMCIMCIELTKVHTLLGCGLNCNNRMLEMFYIFHNIYYIYIYIQYIYILLCQGTRMMKGIRLKRQYCFIFFYWHLILIIFK